MGAERIPIIHTSNIVMPARMLARWENEPSLSVVARRQLATAARCAFTGAREYQGSEAKYAESGGKRNSACSCAATWLNTHESPRTRARRTIDAETSTR